MERKNTKLISCKEVDFYPKLIQQYVDNELKAKNIVNFDYNEKTLTSQINTRNFSDQQRANLVNVLKRQNENLELSDAEKNNLSLLTSKNCLTITTGHQLVLLGGPLFFYSKILDVVQLAKKNSTTDIPVVPVFWMASEDHDFEEIASVNIFGKKITAKGENKGPVGRIDKSFFTEFVTEVKTLLKDDSRYEIILTAIEDAFEKGENLAQITKKFVRFVFKDEGVIVIDGDDKDLKRAFVPIIKDELINQTLNTTTKAVLKDFENEGFKIQVNPREINLFFIQNDYRGRIVQLEGGYATADGLYKWSADDILKLVEEKPECFSPNAVLRTIYQEVVLPNVAYVGGAGEIAYWLELPEAFKAFGVHFPLPIVRKSYFVVQEKLVQWLHDNDWVLTDLFQLPELLEKKFATKVAGDDVRLEQEINELNTFFEKLILKGEAIAPQMAKVVLGEQKRSLSALENVEKRFLNAEKQKHEEQLNKLRNIQDKFLPNQKPMERFESFLPLYVNPKIDLKSSLNEFDNLFDGHLGIITF